MKRSRGLVLGKFMPLHRGHEYLLRFAGNYADEVCVVVDCSLDQTLPVDLRVAWIKQLFPRYQVVGLQQPTPQEPSEHPDFWNYWSQTLSTAVGKVDLLFASETYGTNLAKAIGAQFIPCDIPRHTISISATQSRDDLKTNWNYLSAPAKNHFRRRVVLMGPESTGKTRMAQALAAKHETAWVPEYASEYISANPGQTLTLDDLHIFLRGQLAAQKALEPMAHYYLFSDTDYLSTQIWADLLFQTKLAKPEHAKIPTHTLLFAPTVPWVSDHHRQVLPDAAQDRVRWDFFNRCVQAIKAEGRPYSVIDAPTYPERACQAEDQLKGL